MTRRAKTDRSPLLSIPQAAAQLGLDRTTVYRMVRAGLIGCIDIPGSGTRRHRRIEQREVDRFLDAHRTPATT